MTYSCTDFTDEVFHDLKQKGAVHKAEFDDPETEDNPGLQAEYALRGINRLVELKDALVNFRKAVTTWAAQQGISFNDAGVVAAIERVDKALADIEQRAEEVSDAT